MRRRRPVWAHLVRLGGALAMTGLLLGPSARATTVSPARTAVPTITPVPGHDSSEWLMMGLHCGASLS
jgi:hypothetical protein